jgi:hypothetical protein
VALYILAVAETVPDEETAGAACTLFVPLWALVDVLFYKIYDPHFIREHAKFGVGVLILDEVLGILSLLAFFLSSLVIALLQFQTFASFLGGGFFWGYHLESGR